MKNVSTVTLSKITERGQVTLPKKIRALRAFANARAVAFTERSGVVTIQPITTADARASEQTALLDSTLKEWSDKEHDNLFDFS